MLLYEFQKTDQYILTVKGQDLYGRPQGNTGSGTVTINILDVNDNAPTLEKEEVCFAVDKELCSLECYSQPHNQELLSNIFTFFFCFNCSMRPAYRKTHMVWR